MNNLPAIKNANALIIPSEHVEKLRDQFPVMATAYSSDIIGLMATDNLSGEITKILTSCFQQLGQKVETNDLVALVLQLQKELVRFPLMHIGEISLALTKGVRNEYHETNPSVTINLVRILGWLKSYRSSVERREFLNEKAKLEEKPVPTREEQFELAKSNAVKAMVDKALGRTIESVGLTVYDFLKSLGLIEFTKEERWGFWEEAKEYVRIELLDKKVKAESGARINIQRHIDSIQLGDKESGKGDVMVINRSKKIALNRYFDELIFNGVDLGELIESKKEVFFKQD